MSDDKQAQEPSLDIIADAPPMQPQGSPEAPTLHEVRAEADFLSLAVGEQGVRELLAHFGAKSVDDLAEADWREFIRLANMSCEERAEVLGRKRTAPPPIAAKLSGKATITMRDRAIQLVPTGFFGLSAKAGY